MPRRATYAITACLAVGALAATAALLWPGLPWRSASAEGGPGDEVGELLESIEDGDRPSGWITSDAELRAGPSEHAAVRATLTRSTPLVVREEASGWAHVKVYGRALEGWVRSSAIGTSQEANPTAPR